MNTLLILRVTWPILALAGCAVGPAISPPSPLPSAAATPATKPLPFTIWFKGQTTNLESQYPGLGVTQAYRNESGWATVFLYTNQESDWIDGLADLRLENHFRSNISELHLYESRGSYKDLKIEPAKVINISGQAFNYVEATYLYGTEPVASALLLTVRNRKLLKYRITLYRRSDTSLEETSRGFVDMTLRTDPILATKP